MAIDAKGYVEHVVAPWFADKTTSCDNAISDNPQRCLTPRSATQDWVAQECAVALVYNGISHAVMMASPVDLEAFAVGFSFTEAIVDSPSDIYDIQVQQHAIGLEVMLTISAQCFTRLKNNRRNLVGRTGCGICGVQSLEQMQRGVNKVRGEFVVTHASIDLAAKQFTTYQPLQLLTGAVHGAAWCDQDGNIIAVAEDVGRHNALDKLIGALLASGELSSPGFLLISSRASYEIVQKAARANIAVVCAVSAPTSFAISIADQSRLTLLGFSRAGRHVIYTNEHRVNG